ncbi:MAG: hypothetical protein NVS2B5_04190 [Beijerinckiaceae bacterium]
MRIDADEFAVAIGVTVAGAKHARLDVAHDRAGIAADLVVGLRLGHGLDIGHMRLLGPPVRTGREAVYRPPIFISIHTITR